MRSFALAAGLAGHVYESQGTNAPPQQQMENVMVSNMMRHIADVTPTAISKMML